MTDILIQALTFAIVGPIIGCIVAITVLSIIAYLWEAEELLATLVGFLGLVLAAFIALAGITKGVFLFIKAVF